MNLSRPHFAAIAITIGLVVCAALVSHAAVSVFRLRYRDSVITVTGSHMQRIRSDRVVWSAQVSAAASTRSAAYASLQTSSLRVVEFLRTRRIPDSEVAVEAIVVQEQHARDVHGAEIPEQTVGYVLTQAVVVTSGDVDRVTAVSREITVLMNDGVEVASSAPVYLYTRLAALKIQLLADAARDAYVRADQIARNTHSRLGSLRAAHMGVIQVNAANETEVSAEGVNDTRSIDKDAFAIVRAVFTVD